MSYARGLGQASAGAVAGEINGISTLAYDVQQLVARLSTEWPGERFDASMYRSIKDRARRGELTRMSGREVRQFVYGTAGEVINAIVKAKQLAQIRVSSERARAQNHEVQARVIGPARLMWDAAAEALRDARIERVATSGLGNPLAVAAVIAGAALIQAVFIGSAALAITYWVDSSNRLEFASREAERICREAQPPCSPEQAAQLRRTLSGGGPFQAAAEKIGEGLSEAVVTATVIGVAGAGAIVLGLIGYGIWQSQQRSRS